MEAYQHGASYTAGWLSDFEEQTTLITHHVVPKHGCCKATGIWGMFVTTALFSLSWLICHLHYRYWSVEFYEALLQPFSLWLKFPHFFSPLTHSFSFIYSFIHSYIYTSNTGGGVGGCPLCGKSSHCYLGAHILPLIGLLLLPISLWTLPNLPHTQSRGGKG